MKKFERFLPPHLRYNDMEEPAIDPNILTAKNIMDRARSKVGSDFDILEYMLIEHGRDEAVLYILDELLKKLEPHAQASNDLPSNVQWPATLFNDGLLDPFDIDAPIQARLRCHVLQEVYSAQDHPGLKQLDSIMRQIWLSLGRVTAAATKMEAVESHRIMHTVYRALAKIHHYGLVPDAVYSYQPTSYSSTLNRPPIIHLLSSRILTTLSDAVWRSQQEEIIAKAAESGVPLRNISRDPPGGRFRLKVRELGPEIWLEFILWCCAERGYASIGAKIIEVLRSDTDAPWFAVNWTSNDIGRSVPLVDWDRVKSRIGGTVGRIEGYSREKPLADVPPRTISAEVVLALAEGVISATDANTSAISLIRAARSVRNVISFLEPHGLPTEYFDYLSARLLQGAMIDFDEQPRCLDACIRALGDLRDLESVHPHPVPQISLTYSAIVSQNLMGTGLLQQILTAYVHNDHYLQSMDIFTKLQYEVDKLKLQNVLGFVQAPMSELEDASDGGTALKQLEYVQSYGDLPRHGKAAFLQHMTVNRQLDVAAWTVLSNDVDGPLIGIHAYGAISIASAVVRLAAETGDDRILARVAEVGRKWRFRPAVKFLRHLTDAHIRRLDFHRAELILTQLRDSIAGGYSPANLATLASVILRLQSPGSTIRGPALQESALRQALSLFHRILNGVYDGTSGDFYQTQLILFRQQVGHILVVLASLPQSRLQGLAKQYCARYPAGNAPNLVPAVFNILLAGVVETLGAEAGWTLLDRFCLDARHSLPINNVREDLEMFLSDVSVDADNNDYLYDDEVRTSEAADSGTEVHAVIPGDPYPEQMDTDSSFSDAFVDKEEFSDEVSGLPMSEISIAPEFTDAFGFTSVDPELHVKDSVLSDSADQDQHVASEVWQHVEEGSTSSNPAVVLTLATVRILLRAALRHPNPADTEHLVAWAASFLRHSGLTETDVERETRTGVQQDDAGVTEAGARAYATTPQDGDLTTPVRKHWVSGREHIHRKREVLWQNSLRVT